MRVGPDTPAVVTGGASGLGAATARALGRRGAKVAILDLDAERGAKVAGEAHGLFCRSDVTDPASVAAALARAADAHGPARIAVACAGIAPAARTVDREGLPHDPALFSRVIGINLVGTFLFAAQAAAAMAALEPLTADGERGVIVATASVAAYEGQIGQAAYAASKGGIASLVLPMARDLAKSGIRVAAIAPGLFRTPMLEGLPAEAQASLGAQVPFPARLGEPDEFASLVLAIAENPMLNGSVIRLDGAIRMAPR
jgi:NAD(P)-dependent dehydrogenase (short-subunit alcohol dehydrogenase family)